MRSLRLMLPLAALALLPAALTGCGERAAPPAPPTAAQSSAATNNPAVNQVLSNPKTSTASADYVKRYMPNQPSTQRSGGQ